MWNGFKKTVFEVSVKEEYDANGEVIENDLPKTFREARKQRQTSLRRWEVPEQVGNDGKTVLPVSI
ncbi:MAG: hypothetical protein MZV63_18315 [Marinilabiliales bacterium]|nr:hypothetical protein [Marinilabiliales bacterium]